MIIHMDQSDLPLPELIARDIARADYQAHVEETKLRLQFQFDYAQSALKALLLVNGAALVSLLTFIGNKSAAFDKALLWWSFASFSAGLLLSLLAYFGAYFSQSFFMETTVQQAWNAQRRMHGGAEVHQIEPALKRGNIALWGGVSLATLSVFAFIAGALTGLEGVL